MKTKLYLCSAAMLLTAAQTHADQKQKEKPNILWLTFEDTSSYEFGCYGNTQVSTPNVDALAAKGIQYMNAWSVAPQSSAARSSLITGCYATTYGMDIHPVPYDTPPGIFFPQFLRDAGYYCTNNSKTHYNSTTDHKSCWDECSNTATYNSPGRADGQPFFAVFNTVTSHMGRIRTFHTDGRRDYTQEGIYTDRLVMPPHVPDLPEVRSDYAGHLEAVQDVDTWVGFFLKDLKEKGLDENTIIFVFSDHGGCQPRGKGYLYETGLRVPLVAYFPPKWQHLAPGTGVKDHSLVSFVDLGPSVLSLAGIKTPKHMHGKAVMGKYASTDKTTVQFGLAANQLHHYMPVRVATDGRYKYMRSYIPYRQFALRNYYQWGMPSNKAWDKLVLGKHNTNPDWAQTFQHHPAEMLFDLENDPFELNDLSGSPQYATVLEGLSNRLSTHIRETKDLGFFLPKSREGVILYDKVRKEKYPLNDLYMLVERAGTATPADLPMLEQALTSPLPEMRYWAAVGFGQLAVTRQINRCPQALLALLNDKDAYIACEAAYAAVYLGETDKGLEKLLRPAKEEDRKVGYSLLECISLDEAMRPAIRKYLPELCRAAESLPRKDNEDAGLMARGLLVNLGEMEIKDLHGPESYELGLKLNHGRRPMVPLPVSKEPLTERVNVQGDTARTCQIIDNEWVAVGTNKPHAIQRDYTLTYKGKPSFRFELKEADNTLEGYAPGETKGRAELSYCYATTHDFSRYPAETFIHAQKAKTVYHYGKGYCGQGTSRSYEFSVYVPSQLDKSVSTIFAQWHGMPDRRLVSTPQGEVKMLTMEEFLELENRMVFKKNIAHDKIFQYDKKGRTATYKNGHPVYKVGNPNGWLIEQGGYPPLAFGFSGGYFYIKSNSDRKWLTDKTDRTNASPEKAGIMEPVSSKYKTSTIAYKMPFGEFPKDCWITFRVHIDWTTYSGQTEQIVKPGRLDVTMSYTANGQEVNNRIVDNQEILIGRNDEDGYYFKFGIYRVGNSNVPVCYNLAGYKEW